MPATLLSAIPVLPTLDLAESLAFYRERLGFVVTFHYDDYAGLQRDGVQVHLWLCQDPELPKDTSCRFQVSGIDELYQAYHAQGVIHPNGALETKPWGFREFTALDGDGNGLVFAEPLA